MKSCTVHVSNSQLTDAQMTILLKAFFGMFALMTLKSEGSIFTAKVRREADTSMSQLSIKYGATIKWT